MIHTVRDRKLSLWQSAVEEVAGQAANLNLEAIRSHPVAVAATALAAALHEGKPLSGLAALAGSATLKAVTAATAPATLHTAWQCNQLALRLAWATIHGDTQMVQHLKQQLQFSSCDPLWAETVAHFLLYFRKDKGSIPYRSGGDYVLDYELPAQATIALLGDWGTGTAVARQLLGQVARKNPDVVIHLGDIYYSGTPLECRQRFLDVCRQTLEPKTRLYTLSGNHDMYSGGGGYYWLVDQLGQQASYFCLRNADWLFLAMDTGYNDFDPLSIKNNVTSLAPTEAIWHLDKIREAGGRKIVLLSHHPLFSAFEAIGGEAVNGELHSTFGDVLGRVTAWFWGHEHRLAIYGPYLGLERGRCLGCGAIPVFVAENPLEPRFDVPLVQAAPDSGRPVRLGDDGETCNRAYAILKLDGPRGKVFYYQDSDEEQPLFTETIG